MSGIVIGRKNLLEKIKPYLSGFFENGEYTVFNANTLYYCRKERERESLRQRCESDSVDKILFVARNEEVRELTRRLKGVSTPAYYLPHYLYESINSAETLCDAAVEVDLRKPRLNYLEFHVAYHCNLNCRGCNHFSNLESEENFMDFDSWAKDMQQLKKLFWGIDTIRLMGGEALLHPELWKFVETAREIFPDARLGILTNGLLIPKISDQLVDSMNKAHAYFEISAYIPTEKRKDKILAKLEESKIKHYYHPERVDSFFKALFLNPVSDKNDAFSRCSCRSSVFLRDGMLSPCPVVAMVDKFNERFGFEYPTDERYSIYDVEDAWTLYETLNTAPDFCRYCDPCIDWVEWGHCLSKDAKPEDWLVDEAKIPELKKKQKWSDIRNPKVMIERLGKKYPVIEMEVQYLYHKYIFKD